MNYFIRIIATNKAKNDIDHWLSQWGYTNLCGEEESRGGVAHFFTKLRAMWRIVTTLQKGDTLVLQYPFKKFYHLACRLAHLKGAKVIGIVHDLGAFRRHRLTTGQERRLLAETDFLIVHNDRMEEHLRKHGSTMPIHSLDLFDYLSEATPTATPAPAPPYRVVYAGALSGKRSLFFDALDPVIKGYSLTLYGQGIRIEEGKWQHIDYRGFLPSEEFIRTADAHFGLVWDGFSIDRCDGDWGEYLRINSPHKTSFYLRAGIPVIVWKEAAMADFIVRNGLGVAVASLQDLPALFANMEAEEYQRLQENAHNISLALGEGKFIREALHVAHQHLATIAP